MKSANSKYALAMSSSRASQLDREWRARVKQRQQQEREQWERDAAEAGQ